MEDSDFDYNLWGHAVGLVSGACMASREELKHSISSIENIIGTEYYDGVGDALLKQIVLYLKERLVEA